MALVPTGGALRAFVHRKDLETHRKLLAGSKGEAERSRPKRLLTATNRTSRRAVSGRSAGAGRPAHRGRDQRSRKVMARRKPSVASANQLLGLLPTKDYRRLNTLLAPLVGLCVPHYIQGTMLLGDVTQAAAAFVAVQGAFNWLIDNFPRLAECLSSANRVANRLTAFDRLEPVEHGGGYS
jgi:hypothetical protein